MDDGGVLCPKCANDNKSLDTGENDGWHVVAQDANYEDADLRCDNCYTRIPSAYAEDMAEDMEKNAAQIGAWLEH
jgi:hypothetical protein